MTYPVPNVPPYDVWFDNEVSYNPDVGEYLPELGEPPHPHDSMPIATDNPKPISGKYGPNGFELIYEDDSKPKEENEENLTIHEKMYRIATAKYNPFAVGGSESIHDFE